MTEMSSRPIRQRTFARQTTEPGNPVDGFLWVNPEGGAAGANSERYYWNTDSAAWELESAVGPDTPLYAVSGSIWRDTANAASKQYDGVAWKQMGVTDHGALTGLADDDHGLYATDTKVDNHAADADVHRHMEAKVETNNNLSSESSVTWTTAFGTKPVVTSNVPGNNSKFVSIISRSTTGATMKSWNDTGSSSNATKLCIAMETT